MITMKQLDDFQKVLSIDDKRHKDNVVDEDIRDQCYKTFLQKNNGTIRKLLKDVDPLSEVLKCICNFSTVVLNWVILKF